MNKRIKKKKGLFNCPVCGKVMEYLTAGKHRTNRLCVKSIFLREEEGRLVLGPDKEHKEGKSIE